ncbi:MAG: Putative oxidoreductase [uncultured Phycisphaerae bacterium]|uniref:Oxidoreductase n=1 Tax=uncultured Phycisphaerae bacterium TaxID=904963 RepID=A0A6J4PVF6_9BACT|nr:MAG: Putative oxidoreductase [uncultured Phycisphaerae bacterium]
MERRLRWGILGTGNIARQFAAGVGASARGRVTAVGSRDRASAEAFARKFEPAATVGGYDDVVSSPDVDAVYVSLPNNLHHEWTIRALRAGKHVLCEKPFAVNEAQAREMFDAATRAGRVAVEAFMYRSHPQTRAVLDAIRGGAVGPLRLIRTSFCFHTSKVDGNIRFQPALAGGGIMDVGCYCVNFARLVAGAEPLAVHAVARLHPSGVDDLAAGTLTFPGGVVASFTCGMSAQADNAAHVCGTNGYVEVPVPWKPAVEGSRFSVVRQTPPLMDGVARPSAPPRRVVEVPGGRNLYAYEADDFAAAARDGRAPAVSAADTIGNMRVLDELRRQAGLAY